VAEDALKAEVGLEELLLGLELEVLVVGVQVLLATSEVHHEDLVLLLPQSHQEVLRVHVVVDQSLRVHPLHPLQYLVGDQQHCLQGKLPLAVLEQMFEGRTKNVCDQRAEIVLDAVPVEVGDASASLD
jgi:hypothetical protein